MLVSMMLSLVSAEILGRDRWVCRKFKFSLTLRDYVPRLEYLDKIRSGGSAVRGTGGTSDLKIESSFLLTPLCMILVTH